MAVIDGLISEFGSDLRGWDHSKLATGQAIVELISNGQLKTFVGLDNSLQPEAYDLINEYLFSLESQQHRESLS